MGEHDDDLEVGEMGDREAEIHVAAVVATGLARIAAALEHGLHEVAAAIAAADAPRTRRRHVRPSR